MGRGELRAFDADPGRIAVSQLETNQTGTIRLNPDGEYQARFVPGQRWEELSVKDVQFPLSFEKVAGKTEVHQPERQSVIQ